MTTATFAPIAVGTKKHFEVEDSVRILPFDGIQGRLHAGEVGLVKIVYSLFCYADASRSYDYWIEFSDGEAWLYSHVHVEAV